MGHAKQQQHNEAEKQTTKILNRKGKGSVCHMGEGQGIGITHILQTTLCCLQH